MRLSEYRKQQWDDRYSPHIKPINEYVDQLSKQDRGFVPYVAPIHGGVDARVLSILRDPGPATQLNNGSGFLSVENDDGSAALQSQLLEVNAISPFELLPWNAYPWYINRTPHTSEIDVGISTLFRLLELAPKISIIFLQGRDAKNAWQRATKRNPGIIRKNNLQIIETLHPSPQALFAKDPLERQRRKSIREEAFRKLSVLLS